MSMSILSRMLRRGVAPKRGLRTRIGTLPFCYQNFAVMTPGEFAVCGSGPESGAHCLALVGSVDIPVVVSAAFPPDTCPGRRRVNSREAEAGGSNEVCSNEMVSTSGDMEPVGMDMA